MKKILTFSLIISLTTTSVNSFVGCSDNDSNLISESDAVLGTSILEYQSNTTLALTRSNLPTDFGWADIILNLNSDLEMGFMLINGHKYFIVETSIVAIFPADKTPQSIQEFVNQHNKIIDVISTRKQNMDVSQTEELSSEIQTIMNHTNQWALDNGGWGIEPTSLDSTSINGNDFTFYITVAPEIITVMDSHFETSSKELINQIGEFYKNTPIIAIKNLHIEIT